MSTAGPRMSRMDDATSSTAPDVDAVIVEEPAPTDGLVDAWFVETFHGVPDLGVEHYNRFRTAADRLKGRLRAAKE